MIKFSLDLLSVCFELLIYYYFFRFFFGQPNHEKKIMWLAYFLAGAFSLFLSSQVPPSLLKYVGYFSVIIFLSLFYRGTFFIKAFVPFLFQTISMLVERTYAMLLLPLRNYLETAQTYNINLEYFIGIILSNFTILLLIRFFCSCKEYLFMKKKIHVSSILFVLFILPLITIFTIDQLYSLIIKTDSLSIWTFSPIILLTAINVIFFIFFDRFILYYEQQEQLAVMQKQLEQERQYHNILLDKHQQFQSLRHDSRKHFQNIANLIHNGHAEEALTYAESQAGKYAAVSAIKTSSPLLDTILTIKEEEAQQLGCQFQCYIAERLALPKMALDDLASLLSNILDNALEAVAKIDQPEQRKIWCRLVEEGPYLYIQIQNTVAEDIVIKDNRIATTKEDKTLHGFGLKNIERIVADYGGSYFLSCQQQIFAIKVLFPLSTKEE